MIIGIEIRCFGARHEIIAHKLSPVEWNQERDNKKIVYILIQNDRPDSNRLFSCIQFKPISPVLISISLDAWPFDAICMLSMMIRLCVSSMVVAWIVDNDDDPDARCAPLALPTASHSVCVQ